MKSYIILILGLSLCWACSEDKTYEYRSVRYLHFSKPEIADSVTRLSFSHYPGEKERVIHLDVTLAGDLLTEDAAFQLVVDTDSTTAAPGQYEVALTQVFPARKTTHSIDVKLMDDQLKGKEVTLYLRIAENENFKPGLRKNRTARIVFDDIDSQPLWWSEEIEELFLGPWSAKKYAEFVLSTGVKDLTGYEFTEIRKLCLKFKNDIRIKGLTEEDGAPMIVPVN